MSLCAEKAKRRREMIRYQPNPLKHMELKSRVLPA